MKETAWNSDLKLQKSRPNKKSSYIQGGSNVGAGNIL